MWSKRKTELIIHSIGIVTLSIVILVIICARRWRIFSTPEYDKVAIFQQIADSLEAIEGIPFADSLPVAKREAAKSSAKKIETEKQSAKEIVGEKVLAKKIFEKEPSQKRVENFKLKIVELNGADSVALLSLKGIGPYYAGKIIDYRNRLGGFVSREQLLEIRGIDSARLAMFCQNVKVDLSLVKPITLAMVGESELSANPYIGRRYAKNIVKWREMIPPDSCNVEVFSHSNVLPQRIMLRILPYLR